MFAIVFGCEKFHQYIYGKQIVVETDHKPLVSLINKSFHLISPRLKSMILKLQNYSFKLVHRPGKEMYVADALSRAYLSEETFKYLLNENEAQVLLLHDNLNISDKRMKDFKDEFQSD